MGMANVAVKHGTTVPGNNGIYVDGDACIFYGYAVL
jgi:hypothetical protein